MKILKITTYIFSLLLFAACSSHDEPVPGSGDVTDPSDAVLHINIGVPSGSQSRSGEDNPATPPEITDVVVMLFTPADADHPTTPGALWKAVEASNLEMIASDRYNFDVKYNVDPKTAPASLVCVALANGEHRFTEIKAMEGRTYAEIQREIAYTYQNRKAMTDRQWEFTMWGIATAAIDTSVRAQSVKISLIRDWAKTTVTLSDEAIGEMGHSLAEIGVYNRYDSFSLMPQIDADGKAVLPSIPANASKSEWDDNTPTTATTLSMILPEQNILMGSTDGNPADANQFNRPALIVGLRWKGGAKIYYYRLDFTEDDLLIDVMRNHHYVFNITAINGPGSDTPAEAYNTLTANVEATLTPWDNIDRDAALDGENWISIPRQVNLGPEAGAEASVNFTTNVEPSLWELQWVENGEKATNVPFEFILPADAETPLKIKALSALPEGTDSRSAQLLINVTPRLRLIINVTQQRSSSSGGQTDWKDQNIYGEI